MNHLIPHFISQNYEKGILEGSFEASALSVDLSGFTALTESLMTKGNVGAEQLTVLLNQVFQPLVDIVYKHRGIIPYFAGDAFVAIFPKDQKLHEGAAVQVALEISDFFTQVNPSIAIGFRIGIANGSVEWGIVGNFPKGYYFRGIAITNATECQKQAQVNKINIHPTVDISAIYQFAKLIGTNQFGCFQIEAKPDFSPTEIYQPFIEPNEMVTRLFIPDSVILHRKSGEFRTVISIFISFTGLESHHALNILSTIVLEEMFTYSGYLKEIEFGDKGGVLTCFFGAPQTFENIADRAYAFLRAFSKRTTDELANVEFSWHAGMTQGRTFAGFIGNRFRYQYALVGNCVNLAARLMSIANPLQIWADESIAQLGAYELEKRGLEKLKGISKPMSVYELVGKRMEIDTKEDTPFIGRVQETQQILGFIHRVTLENTSGLIVLFGEGGIGKTTFLTRIKRNVTEEGGLWLTGRCDQLLRKPFNPFMQILKNYFSLPKKNDQEHKLEIFEKKFKAIINQSPEPIYKRQEAWLKNLQKLKTVIAALLEIPYQVGLWKMSGPKEKYQNTILALSTFIQVLSIKNPVFLLLEDSNWIDESSKKIIQNLIEDFKIPRIQIILTSRFNEGGKVPDYLDSLLKSPEPFSRFSLILNSFSKEEVHQMALKYLGAPISESLYQFVALNTQNNPYYLENIFNYFKDQQILEKVDGQWILNQDELSISYSMNSVLLSKIDRLSPNTRELIKIASVFGISFNRLDLIEALRMEPPNSFFEGIRLNELAPLLAEAVNRSILTSINPNQFFFNQALLRDTAYEMQLPNNIKKIHEVIVQAYQKALETRPNDPRYYEIGYHLEKAGQSKKALEYFLKAADTARKNYQNEKSLEYYLKVLQGLSDEKTTLNYINVLTDIFKLQTIIGKWKEALKTAEEAVNLAQKNTSMVYMAKAYKLLGEYLLLSGEYFEAKKHLLRAESYFSSVNYQEGLIELSGNLGNLYYRQGEYEMAKSYYQVFLENRHLLPETQEVANIAAELGLAYMNQGDYDQALKIQNQYLKEFEKEGNFNAIATLKVYIGVVLLEKGDLEAAQASFTEGQKLSKSIGNTPLTAIVASNLGIIYERKGNYSKALKQFKKDLSISEKIGDKEGVSVALALIGELKSYQGKFHKAIEYLQKALMIAEEMNYKKGIAKAVNTLGDVFYFTGQLDRSLAFYNQAIDNARQIGNKLVLAASLNEKGWVLYDKKESVPLEKVIQESIQLTSELENQPLYFEVQILSGKLLQLKGEKEEALKVFHSLLNQATDDEQTAAVYYEIFVLDGTDITFGKKALDIYKNLSEKTSKFVYNTRLAYLEKAL
ncbi:MAG: hypothetical protein RLZZ248_2033 [Bacteroidota bacterium]